MDSSDRPECTLGSEGDLIAAVPHILGFHPTDSMVLVFIDSRQRITQSRRFDVPASPDHAELLRYLVRAVPSEVVAMVLVGVGGGRPDSVGRLPHAALASLIADGFARERIRTTHRLWVPATTAGARWHSYDDSTRSGLIPDPGTSELAALAACNRSITYGSREEIVAIIKPDDEESLARRARLVQQLRQDERSLTSCATARERLRLVNDAIDRAGRGILPCSDGQVVQLALALGDTLVRDALLDLDEAQECGAELLWASLTRQTPAPERANPAALLAFFAYRRGDGVLAGIAVENAQQAVPDHRLAYLLRVALDSGVTPQNMRLVGDDAAKVARQRWGGSTRPHDD